MNEILIEKKSQLNDTGTIVTFKLETKCHSEDEMREALGFLARESHKFYMDSAAKIKCRLS